MCIVSSRNCPTLLYILYAHRTDAEIEAARSDREARGPDTVHV